MYALLSIHPQAVEEARCTDAMDFWYSLYTRQLAPINQVALFPSIGGLRVPSRGSRASSEQLDAYGPVGRSEVKSPSAIITRSC